MELPELPPLPEAAVHDVAGEWPEFARSQMIAYALEAVRAERERCARIAEATGLAILRKWASDDGYSTDACNACAAAIRAQGS